MHLEVVTHCWAGVHRLYAQALCYQLSCWCWRSWGRGVRLTHRLFVAPQQHDPTTWEVIQFFRPHLPEVVELVVEVLPRERLFRRAVGRNLACRRSQAQVLLFTDCDYLWDTGSLEAIQEPQPLAFPRVIHVCRDHATGDRYLAQVDCPRVLLRPKEEDFLPRTMRRAIGGVQIVSAQVARRVGYVPHLRRYHRPSAQWCDTPCDAAFRRQLGTPGVPQDLPGVYRLRHSRSFRDAPGKSGRGDLT